LSMRAGGRVADACHTEHVRVEDLLCGNRRRAVDVASQYAKVSDTEAPATRGVCDPRCQEVISD
jgi:hypothetical protein